ncbi:hypothetical protein AC579_9241 [Pseudocercospora musae]|uniref:Uncharacterized protein n=1 Tax=Pseudocercospora musae TaxID=113226 RepID=A0A139IAX3_9PEZI|nr:hypothetical protein AC579_9241 [Pseudocercospora musae]
MVRVAQQKVHEIGESEFVNGSLLNFVSSADAQMAPGKQVDAGVELCRAEVVHLDEKLGELPERMPVHSQLAASREESLLTLSDVQYPVAGARLIELFKKPECRQ